MVAGKQHSCVLRVEGFDSVRRLNLGTVEVDEQMLAKYPA
jgi:hypothetical protein